MGAWGTAIFSDDTASDIRGDYNELLCYGHSDEEAEQHILNTHGKECIGTDEEPVFWYALALAEWKRGRLSPTVRERALHWLRDGVEEDLARWEEPQSIKKRREVLRKLEETLTSEMPKRTKPSKPKPIRSPWGEGDVFAYPMAEDMAAKYGFPQGSYALIRVAKVDRWKFSRFSKDPEDYNESVEVMIYKWHGENPEEVAKRLSDMELAEWPSDPKNPNSKKQSGFDFTFLRKEIEELNTWPVIARNIANPIPENLSVRGYEMVGVYAARWYIPKALRLALGS